MHSILSLVISLSVLSAAAPAWAGDTFFVDSVNGNDANDCLTSGQACLTIAHATTLLIAQDKPQNSTLKLSGTFAEPIDFSASDVSSSQTLDGLRITATDKDNKPTIDATGQQYGVSVTQVNDLTVDHLLVSGSQIGIYVAGYSGSYIDHADLHHNTITGLIGNPDFTGISVSLVKQSTIEYNTIRDITLTTIDSDDYSSSEGIYLNSVRNSAVRNNTVRGLEITNHSTAVANSHYTYLYGISGSVLTDVLVKKNTITTLTVTDVSTLASVSHTNFTAGIYLSAATNLQANKNTVTTISAASDATGIVGDSITSQAYGMYLADIRLGSDNNTVTGNTIDGVTATQAVDSGGAYSYGMRLEYIYGTTIHNNTVKTITATASGTLANADYTASVYGVYGPYIGDQLVLTDNTIRTLTATTNYSGADSSAYPSIRGLYMYAAGAQADSNTIRDLTWSTEQNGAANAADYPYMIGMEVANAHDLELTHNVIRTITGTYNSTGVDGYFSPTTYGIYSNSTTGALITNNTVKDIDYNFVLADATGASYGYSYLMPFHIKNSTNTVIGDNSIKDITTNADGGVGNPMSLTFYGYYLNSSDAVLGENSLTNLTQSNVASADTTGNTVYGIYSSGLGLSVLHDNLLKRWTITSTSPSANQTINGINIAGGKPVYVNSNQVRNITATSNTSQTVIGINLSTDVSSSRLFNNVLMGKEDYAGTGTYVGMYLQSDSTVDLDVVNNTVANWKYPVQLDGGENVLLLNNILAATTNTGAAMAIKYDHVNLDRFRSDYNLMYTPAGKAEAIYNLDDAASVHFGDWSNDQGSYGYDLHSRYHQPGINSSGRLQNNSKAIDHGSTNISYDDEALADTMIAIDINGTSRPGADGRVDIGADEL